MQKPVRLLIDALGLGDALVVCEKWSGRTLSVPRDVGRTDPLALALGYGPARRLVDALGGQELELPVERNALLELRNEAILQAEEGGKSHEKIGAEFGLTRSGVAKAIRAARSVRDQAGAAL